MDRVYAFTDEYGGFGWNLVNPTVSSNYIITAIIVKESDLETFTVQSEAIRKKYFQAGEMKSSKVGKNHRRRQLILNALMPLPFKIFSVCIDKRLCLENMSCPILLCYCIACSISITAVLDRQKVEFSPICLFVLQVKEYGI